MHNLLDIYISCAKGTSNQLLTLSRLVDRLSSLSIDFQGQPLWLFLIEKEEEEERVGRVVLLLLTRLFVDKAL